MRSLMQFIRNEEGQDLVEYALLAALLSIASVAALKTLGPKLAGMFNKVAAEL